MSASTVTVPERIVDRLEKFAGDLAAGAPVKATQVRRECCRCGGDWSYIRWTTTTHWTALAGGRWLCWRCLERYGTVGQ